MTVKELAKIEARALAVQCDDWEVTHHTGGVEEWYPDGQIELESKDGCGPAWAVGSYDSEGEERTRLHAQAWAQATLFAHARKDILALVAEVARARINEKG